LVAADYIQKDNQTCPNKEEVIITAEGKVMKADKALDVPDTKSDE
jgi:hypothetical protein